MKHRIDQLLRVVADYHQFREPAKASEEEMSLDELDLVAAAAQQPVHPPLPETKETP